MDVEPIRSIIETRLGQQLSFFNLMQGYLAVVLAVGIAGIGVIMVRAVCERRREVGVLRALGFPAPGAARLLRGVALRCVRRRAHRRCARVRHVVQPRRDVVVIW